jgi:hypothetical protein
VSRYKTFDATGIPPGGRLFAGDMNAIQDRMADASNFAQTIDLAVLRIGDTAIQFLKFGTGEARLVGALRTDGIVRALGGLFAGAYTTAQRDAIAAGVGLKPFTLIIFNTTTNQFEYNAGTDSAPNWTPLGGNLTIYAQQSGSYTLALSDAGKMIEVNAAGANTLTVPADGTVNFQIGTSVSVGQIGAGQTTLAPAGGVTLRGYNSNLKLAGQYAVAQLVKRAANDWWAFGNLVP